MTYIELDFDALYNEALLIYRQNGGDVLFPGDEKEMLLRTILGILQQERASLNAAIAQGTFATRKERIWTFWVKTWELHGRAKPMRSAHSVSPYSEVKRALRLKKGRFFPITDC